jgi:hypothetical protein
MRSRRFVAGVAVCLAGMVTSAAVASPTRREKTVNATESEVERLEVAREHFQRGERLAAEGALEAAIVEYELAEVAHPSPMVTAAKERVRAAIEARHAAAPAALASAPARAPTRNPLRRFIAPIVLAPIALGALVAGGALVGTVRSDVSHLRGTCAPACAPADVDPLRSREAAAYGLLATGAVLAAADAVLWGVLSMRGERTPPLRASAAFSRGSGGLALEGRF